MRIERGQHAVDRPFHQRIIIDLAGVIGPHILENFAEQIEFFVSLR